MSTPDHLITWCVVINISNKQVDCTGKLFSLYLSHLALSLKKLSILATVASQFITRMCENVKIPGYVEVLMVVLKKYVYFDITSKILDIPLLIFH